MLRCSEMGEAPHKPGHQMKISVPSRQEGGNLRESLPSVMIHHSKDLLKSLAINLQTGMRFLLEVGFFAGPGLATVRCGSGPILAPLLKVHQSLRRFKFGKLKLFCEVSDNALPLFPFHNTGGQWARI